PDRDGQPRARGRRVAGVRAHLRRRRLSRRVHLLLWALAVVVWLAALATAAGRLADDQGWWTWDPVWSRTGAAVATWLGLALLSRRIGGRTYLVGAFSGVLLALAVAVPESWALAGVAVAAAATYGALGMVMTRPAAGGRALRELCVAGAVGAAGAVVVAGYDVALRPYRFRIAVLILTLAVALALARRLGAGVHSLGRRGLLIVVLGVCVLAASVAYVQAVRHWGSPGVVASLTDAKVWLHDLLGATPRPMEALVGFPAVVWGVTVRNRRRQGWWISAFGALGSAGVATCLVRPLLSPSASMAATGYDLAIGAALGLMLVGVDRLLTGTGRRARRRLVGENERPEPARQAALL
ncbi:MAG: hypothetical protein ACRDP4_06595, partial [Nocardioidaceae bacterium]